MKDFILQDELPITVDEFWNLFFKEDEFTLIFHEKRGDSDTQVGSWTMAPEGRKQRVVRFVSPTASNSTMRRIAGVTTQIKEIQLCYFAADGSFHMQCKRLFEKTSLVEIDCKMNWDVTPSKSNGNRSCQCAIKFTNEFKGKLFKESVETYVSEEMKDACEQWLALAHEKISDYLPDIQQLRREEEEAMALQRQKQKLMKEVIPRGDESEEEPSPIVPKKEGETIVDSENRAALKESAVERAKRIIAQRAEESSSEDSDDEEDQSTEEDDDSSDDKAKDDSDDDDDVGFFDTNDELSALAGLDQAKTMEEKVALLQAYSRAMQMELAQMKELMLMVQTRMMRLETPSISPPTNNNTALLSSTPRQQQQTPGYHRNGKTPLTDSGNGFNSEDLRYRDLAIQRSINNTQRRLEELEQKIEMRLSFSNNNNNNENEKEAKKKRGGSSLLSNPWLVNVPLIVFVICWPLVSQKVSNWGLDWGSRFLLQLQKLVLRGGSS